MQLLQIVKRESREGGKTMVTVNFVNSSSGYLLYLQLKAYSSRNKEIVWETRRFGPIFILSNGGDLYYKRALVHLLTKTQGRQLPDSKQV
jgi:hypothetical protein